MGVFGQLSTFPFDKEFTCFERNGEPDPRTREKNIAILADESERSLVELHQRYRIFIRVTTTIVKTDRFIFNVDTLQETKDSDISKGRKTVQRRLKKYDYFRVDLSDKKSIKLIVVEKPL